MTNDEIRKNDEVRKIEEGSELVIWNSDFIGDLPIDIWSSAGSGACE